MAPPPTFPTLPGITWPVRRIGPIFNTTVQRSVSSKTTAFGKQSIPQWRWELPFEFLREGITDGSGTTYNELQQLAGFYASRFGRLYTFAYKDAKDNLASAQGFGLGNGATTSFQLVRTYGGFTEPVYLPTGTVYVSVNGVIMVPGTDYTISDTGRVIFTVAPPSGAVLAWSGSFNWLCRFDDEGLEFSNFLNGYWSSEKVSFTSVVP